ncbi:hypothetical protein C8R47DRAFT_1328845 [Mycena vitilis]|nr:hypothetical protein C8R47DRAFT_1328845 [Mycena vitilis]
MLALGGYLVVFILQATQRDMAQRQMKTIGASVNLIAVAVVDLLTAGGLIWELDVKPVDLRERPSHLEVSAFLTFQIAPLYTLTLLFYFNAWRADEDEEALSSKPPTSRKAGYKTTLRVALRWSHLTLPTRLYTDAIEKGGYPSTHPMWRHSAKGWTCVVRIALKRCTSPVLIYGDGIPQAV